MIAFMTSRWFYESYQEPTCLLTTKPAVTKMPKLKLTKEKFT